MIRCFGNQDRVTGAGDVETIACIFFCVYCCKQ